MITPYIFYPLIIIAWLIDIVSFSLMGHQILMIVLCLYIQNLYHKPLPIIRLILLGSLLAVNSFIIYGIFGFQLLYILPTTIFILYNHHLLYNARIQYIAHFSLLLLIQSMVLEPILLEKTTPLLYTIMTLCANIIVIILFL